MEFSCFTFALKPHLLFLNHLRWSITAVGHIDFFFSQDNLDILQDLKGKKINNSLS